MAARGDRPSANRPLWRDACGQRLHVVDQRRRRVDAAQLLLGGGQFGRRHRRLQRLEQHAAVLAHQQRAFGGGVRVAQRKAHQEAVQLRLRQRKGADLVGGILRGDDEERLRQRARDAVGADLALLHRLQQAGLGLRRGAVDFIGQQHLGEDRARMEHEAVLFALVDGDAVDVRRQQVAGELHAVEAQAQRQRQRVGQRGLAHARHVLHQQVAAGQQAGQRLADLQVLADDDVAHLPCDGVQFCGHGMCGRLALTGFYARNCAEDTD
jgi:hypothetical protein